MTISTLAIIVCILLTVLAVTVIFRHCRLPLVLGYFVVGALLGPHALNLIPNIHDINELAEFGVVFLMFTVGLEFSLPKLIALRRSVFLVGGLQVLLSIIATTAIGRLIGMDFLPALVVGGIVAMSSTAIVVKQLQEQRELHSTYGLNAIGILLFQDIAVIPVIILIASLSAPHNNGLSTIFFWASLKGILAILLLTLAGRFLLKRVFHTISRTRTIELFTLTVLLITLTAAWLTNLLGLSYALGAFLAGIMLSETEFRHQIEIEIRPFRDILLGLFFISIGMLADVQQWPNVWPWIALLLLALLFGKMILVSIISYFSGYHHSDALRTGLVLAQGGEFGFAILTLAITNKAIPVEYNQAILAALLISIALSPIFIYFNRYIALLLLPKSEGLTERAAQRHIASSSKRLSHHIIICGYGRVGQHVARMLDKVNYPYIGLDIDSELIQRADLAGDKVLYGDASHPSILEAAGLHRAKALVISFDHLESSIRTLSLAKQLNPNLPTLVRCKDQKELVELKKYNPTKVIAEIFEGSLTLSQHLLQLIEMPTEKIAEFIQEVRNKDYELLRRIFPSSFNEGQSDEVFLHESLTPILLPRGAYAINHRLGEFDFNEIGIEVIAIRRGKAKPIKPHPNIKLYENDILVVYGNSTSIEKAERVLLEK